MSNRICQQCGFENDHTRVFCQNCGTRLPVVEESTLPADSAPAAAPSAGKLFIPPSQQAPVSVRRPIRPVRVSEKTAQPVRRKSSVIGRLFSTAIFGAIIAAGIQMARQPENILPGITPNPANAAEVYNQIRSASTTSLQRNVVLAQIQVNNYLASRLVSAPDDGSAAFYKARFERLFVELGTGQYRMVVEQKLNKWPFYISLIQRPVSSASGLSVVSVGGAIGRLPIHPALMPYFEKLFSPNMLESLDVIRFLRTASSVAITPSHVVFTWTGGAPVGTP